MKNKREDFKLSLSRTFILPNPFIFNTSLLDRSIFKIVYWIGLGKKLTFGLILPFLNFFFVLARGLGFTLSLKVRVSN